MGVDECKPQFVERYHVERVVTSSRPSVELRHDRLRPPRVRGGRTLAAPHGCAMAGPAAALGASGVGVAQESEQKVSVRET